MTPEEKIDDCRAMLHEMRPMLALATTRLDSMDGRLRVIEIKQEGQDVRITRLTSDFDGLGRKLRYFSDRHKTEESLNPGKWFALIELLTFIPRYWHIITLLSLTAGGVVYGLREVFHR